jgi:hypothetical protein
MPNLGRETVGSLSNSYEGFFNGHPVTMPETGDFTTLTAYIAEVSTPNEHVTRGVIYNASTGALIGQTNTRQDISATPGWVTFTFAAPVTVNSGTAIVLGVAGGSGGGTINVFYENGVSGDGKHVAAPAFPTMPDPATLSNNALQFSIYGTYTAAGGGGGVGKRVFGSPVFSSRVVR